MSIQGGNLHWCRRRIALAAGLNNIDTFLAIANRAYGPLEPSLGLVQAAAPAPGTLPASRIQVIPEPPLPDWLLVTAIGEPYMDTDTDTIHVTLTASEEVTVNVLFWNPHTIQSPGQADTYNAIA